MPSTVVATNHRQSLSGLSHLLPRNLVLGVAGVVGSVVLWHFANVTGLISEESLPRPLAVADRLAELIIDGKYRAEIYATLSAWAVSMVIAIVIAVPVGVLLGYFQILRRPTVALIHAFRSVPLVALIPIAVLILGMGLSMKVALSVFIILWLILLNTIYGVQGTDRQLIEVARSLRWGRLKILRKVVLPCAMPSIATGVRVSGSICLIVVLSVEIIAAGTGIGHLIMRFQADVPARTDFAYAAIILTGIIGVILYSAIAYAERKLLPWSHMNRAQAD